MTSKNKIDDFIKRLDNLDANNIKVFLDFIKDADNDTIAYRLRAVNRLNVIIEQEIIRDIPTEYINKYCKKYKINCKGGKCYNLINNELIEVTL